MITRSAALGALVGLFLMVGATWGIPPRTPREAEAYRLLREKKFAESAELFTQLVRDNPYAGDLAAAFGQALHGAGRDDEAIRAMKTAAELGWTPSANYYNIACVLALRGDKDQAIEWLRKSLDAGFAEQETLLTDSDMDPLRGDPRFVELTGLKPPPGADRDGQWRYDLDFFARRMKQMHWNLYAKVSKETFLGELEQLKAQVPKLEDRQILARLMRIVASVGDGHTRLRLTPDNAPPPPRLPVSFYQFEDGLVITSADPHCDESLLGAKVLKFGSMPVESAAESVKPYCSVDSPMGYLSEPARLLTLPWILEAIGAGPGDGGSVEITVRGRDGAEKTAKLTPIVVKPEEMAKTFVRANKFATAPVPLYLKDPDTRLRYEFLPERKLMYFYFGGVVDPPDASFEKFVKGMLDAVEKSQADYLVIDMRHNNGGNTGLVSPLIHGLVRCGRVNRDGGLFVITSRDTYSAAVNTVSLLEEHTHASFVGEPPGSPPIFVGESTYLTLPYHGNRVFCSSRYWQWGPSIDKRQWVAPQIAVKRTSRDFLENRDPVMDAIFTAIDSRADAAAPSTRP
jgi:hypothetical protein